MKRRSVGAVIVLTIITCGIYFYYWLVMTTNEVEEALGPDSDGSCKSGGMALLLSIITCGIYLFYWWYKMGVRTKTLGNVKSVAISDNGLAYSSCRFSGCR